MMKTILFAVALLPLLATVDCKPAGSSGIICDAFLRYGYNEDHGLQHDCENDKRFKVSFNRSADQEKAAIQLFFEPREALCVDKLGLGDSNFFCGWKDMKSSTDESCDHRSDYTAQWQESGTTGENGIHIRVFRSMMLKNASGCEWDTEQ